MVVKIILKKIDLFLKRRSIQHKYKKQLKQPNSIIKMQQEQQTNEVTIIADVVKGSRAKCENSCCEVVTKLLCVGCEKKHVCKKHNKCESCKTNKTVVIKVQKMDVVSDEDDKKEKARERARNYYRIKQGIPVDAPLIQRGGAHNVKYHTEAEKAERAKLEKEYQKEYQKKYREKKANKEEPIKRTMEEFRDAILAKQNAKFDILINELVEEFKQGK
jgi:hypothetical protein